MNAIDPWPAAPVLGELPAVARLDFTVDPEPLAAEARSLGDGTWAEILIMTGTGLDRLPDRPDWRTIPLRSIGGDPARTDPGGPDLADFADTPWLARLPAFRRVLEAVPAPLRSARLMALGPGARVPLHSDTKTGLPWGTVRLHVPVVTVSTATLLLADEHHCWPAGELWYADFTRPHSVQNEGSERRVHLVLDVGVTASLLALFPAAFRTSERQADYLMQPDGAEAGPTPQPLSFLAPPSFLSFEAADGAHVHDSELVPMSVRDTAKGPTLLVEDVPRFGLVGLGSGEFRLAGWTTERTIRVDPERGTVALCSRKGRQEWLRTLLVDRPAGACGQAR